VAVARLLLLPFTPGALGSDTVTVSVPADDVNTNNSLSKPLNITPVNYTYKHPGSIASGGVGFTGATGDFVAKFNTTSANAVTAITLEFPFTSTTTYKAAIYGDAAGIPSTTSLYVDAANRTVTTAGPVTITLPSPVAEPGIMKTSGRGVFLINQFMDEVRYEDGGRTLHMRKRPARPDH